MSKEEKNVITKVEKKIKARKREDTAENASSVKEKSSKTSGLSKDTNRKGDGKRI